MAEFQVVHIPKLRHYDIGDPVVHTLAARLRELRLFSLQDSPEAFGSSYHDEMQRDLSDTVQKLSDPIADYFVVIRQSDNSSTSATEILGVLTEFAWMGLVKLIQGRVPQAHSASRLSDTRACAPPSANTARDSEAPVAQFYMNGTFVHPDARGTGVGKAMIQAAFRKAKAHSEGVSDKATITVLVNRENQAACRLYASSGFRVTGEESYMQRTWSPDNQLVEIPRRCYVMEKIL